LGAVYPAPLAQHVPVAEREPFARRPEPARLFDLLPDMAA
jgi:hypothetical protein